MFSISPARLPGKIMPGEGIANASGWIRPALMF